jgi:excisionase family DNA binding protein
METPMQPTLSVRDAARLLRVTPRTVRNWIASGHLHATRVSERVTLVPLTEIERLTGTPARPDLSSVIWDVDLSTLDEERNADFIIRRVLESGRPDQVAWLFRRYGDARIEQVAGRERGLTHPAAVAWRELLRRRRERVA